MTPSGPAVLQVIDFPGQLPAHGFRAGGSRRSGGIHILSAILRRWWLVLIVLLVVGGGVFVAASVFMHPAFVAVATIRYHTEPLPGAQFSGDPVGIIRSTPTMVNGGKITLLAARNPALAEALPWLKPFLPSLDKTPASQRELITRLKGMVDVFHDESTSLISVYSEKSDGVVAAALAESYAEAIVAYVTDSMQTDKSSLLKELSEQYDGLGQEQDILQRKHAELKVAADIDAKEAGRASIITLINDLQTKRAQAMLDQLSAARVLEMSNKNDASRLSAGLQKMMQDLVQQELDRDSILQAAIKEQVAAFDELQAMRATNMSDEHPDVIRSKQRVDRSINQVADRTSEVQAIVNRKVLARINLEMAEKAETAQKTLEDARAMIEYCDAEKKKKDAELAGMSGDQARLQDMEGRLTTIKEKRSDTWGRLQDLRREIASTRMRIEIEDPAFVTLEPTTDKRTKVQAGGLFGGLFLGILLALLVDKFDKRLRDPRDMENLMGGAPVLGLIPRIQELKRIKGDQARNLIAEEFRVIRTQLLFGNPNMQYKTICVTSPQPGDGTTSLAVNLAISIAKAGRRTLLIDGDLRKPDVHRIFNIPDSPGLAEMIQGTCEPGGAIRKSDIELLDVLPAGIPMVRPSELISRPELARIIDALSELYDHIIFDTAPLLPVSDTHVLAGLVDGVVCSFNADVDTDTVGLVEEILRRSNANLIGTVMNQVKYKQSNSYHRGKTAYDSYYNSPRGVTTPPPAASQMNKAQAARAHEDEDLDQDDDQAA